MEKIPNLNAVTSVNEVEQLDGNLVRFHGMVQNQIDYDYFTGVLNTSEKLEECQPHKYFQLRGEELDKLPPTVFQES